jgi:hypothetical protein
VMVTFFQMIFLSQVRKCEQKGKNSDWAGTNLYLQHTMSRRNRQSICHSKRGQPWQELTFNIFHRMSEYLFAPKSHTALHS